MKKTHYFNSTSFYVILVGLISLCTLLRLSTSTISTQFRKSDEKRYNVRVNDVAIPSENSTTAFIIRAHSSYSHALLSLLYGLESQRNFPGKIVAVVVPTEHDQLAPLKSVLEVGWSTKITKKVSVHFFELSEKVYESNCCLLQSLCTPQWKADELANGFSKSDLERVCSINSPLHYHVTDLALKSVLTDCPLCDTIVVTNADNSYSPMYLQQTISYMSQGYDFVITDMVHANQFFHAEARLGHMDLGGVIMSSAFIAATKQTFVTALPKPSEAHHYHDADYFFIKKMIQLGARVGVLHSLLFNHN